MNIFYIVTTFRGHHESIYFYSLHLIMHYQVNSMQIRANLLLIYKLGQGYDFLLFSP